jgi:hypothetical protein
MPCDASLHRSNLVHGVFCFGQLTLDSNTELLKELLTGHTLHVKESSSFLAQLLNRKEVAYIIVFKKGFHPQQLMSIEAYFPQKPFLQATKPAHANLHMRKTN